MGHMEEHDCTVLPALQPDYSFLLAYRIWLGAHKSTKWHLLQDKIMGGTTWKIDKP